MLPRSQRLTSAQFDHAFAHSQQVRHPLVVLRAHFRGDDQTIIRAAFVVPKKQAKKATQRNLIRRRLRERYRLHPSRELPTLQGYDLIFMATPQTAAAPVAALDAALEEVMRRAGKTPHDGERKPERRKRAEHASNQPEPAPVAQSQQVADNPDQPRPALPVAVALELIRFYQRFISPGLPPSCRFEPSCSRYTYASIERFGVLRGCFLGATRICKCHPWHQGGYDPVPQEFPFVLSKGHK